MRDLYCPNCHRQLSESPIIKSGLYIYGKVASSDLLQKEK